MLTKEELIALVQILNRIPVTQAEGLWLQTIIAKLTPPEPPKEE